MITTKMAREIFITQGGTLRTSDALAHGITPPTLYAMRDKEIITEIARGIYRLADIPELEHPDYVTIVLRHPKAIIALISALSYHGLTTEIPLYVYIALPRGHKKPENDYPPLEAVWLSPQNYEAGIEVHTTDGQDVKIYSKEKSICDAFKFRNKYGEEPAIEALKTYLHEPDADVPGLMRYARINRVQNIMRPYLKGIL